MHIVPRRKRGAGREQVAVKATSRRSTRCGRYLLSIRRSRSPTMRIHPKIPNCVPPTPAMMRWLAVLTPTSPFPCLFAYRRGRPCAASPAPPAARPLPRQHHCPSIPSVAADRHTSAPLDPDGSSLCNRLRGTAHLEPAPLLSPTTSAPLIPERRFRPLSRLCPLGFCSQALTQAARALSLLLLRRTWISYASPPRMPDVRRLHPSSVSWLQFFRRRRCGLEWTLFSMPCLLVPPIVASGILTGVINRGSPTVRRPVG
ncbi:hypothetical protein B0H14DRAFT_3065468 [Mycena olivaceomarginata]|nr:hypothetical protein B0H14DRAFT_3065468 [Mycena olivaceomarginata]